ncbi:MAG: hypothetical protein AB7Q69_08075 [Gemmatimonadales bacterium]
MKRLLLAAGVFVFAGCGGDGAGPNPTVNVAGTWDLSISSLSGAGISCTLTGMVVVITQAGTTFSGSYNGGTMQCYGPGGSTGGPIGSGTVVNGKLSGSEVQFDLDTQDIHQTGSIGGNSMSGTTTWRLDLGAPTGVIVLSGNWSAARR